MTTKRANGNGSIYQRKSNKLWYASAVIGYDSDGEPVRKTVSSKSRPEAVENLERLQAMAQTAQWADADRITLQEWLEDWLETTARPRVTLATYEGYRAMVRGHIVPILGSLQLVKAQAFHVRKLLAEVAKKYSLRTGQYVHTVLNMALKQALQDGLIKANPCAAVKRPVPKRKRVTVLTDAQVRQLFKHVEGTNCLARDAPPAQQPRGCCTRNTVKLRL